MIKLFNVILNYIMMLKGFSMCKINIEDMKRVYDKYRNLKLAADELGMVWQTLYYHLNKHGHPVIGDKELYGNPTDKMAKYFEDYFKNLIPEAKNFNQNKFQAKVDFKVGNYYIDVKSSTKKDSFKNTPKKNPCYRWAFSVNSQQGDSDFIICFCTSGYECDDFGGIEKILLIPKEFYKNKQSISVSCTRSKWYDFEISEDDLKNFLSAR